MINHDITGPCGGAWEFCRIRERVMSFFTIFFFASSFFRNKTLALTRIALQHSGHDFYCRLCVPGKKKPQEQVTTFTEMVEYYTNYLNVKQ